MNKLATLLTMLGLAAGATGVAVAYYPITDQAQVIYAQEDCAENETWNEETLKCEPKEATQ